ncbi:MAG: M23 family metallopeptidase [Devosia sp.]
MSPKGPYKPFRKHKAAAVKPTHRHTLSVRPVLLYGGFLALMATNAVTLVGMLMAPDLAHLMGSGTSLAGAYEDRIAQLRLEVDRLQSRHYAQAGDINLQLQELAQTQEVLVEQHQYVRQLADKAAALGIDAPPAAGAAKPVTDTLITGSISPSANPADRVAAVAADLNSMMADSKLALAAISDEASSKTDRIMGALATIGIAPKLPDDADAEGGPLLPPVDGADAGSLVDDANAVATALERYRIAKGAADIAPIHKPVLSVTRISSTFGNRTDPFTGRLAFHSGIDFAAPQGTTVMAAGSGKVTFVGQISGYGNAVEITHVGGIITLYGHLSAFLVKQGDMVGTGDPIARVGSTGRSTGPHLHFEVRRADDAINPAPFLAIGRTLQKIVAS